MRSWPMGLDACVYCDCYERGRLLTPPPAGLSLCVEPDGFLGCETQGVPWEVEDEFDCWKARHACEHPGGVLLHHRLGNISLIALLRSELSRSKELFPILIQKVIYNGIHAGDYLTPDAFPALEKEVARIRDFKCQRSSLTQFLQDRWPTFGTTRRFRLPSATADFFMQQFRIQMEELLATGKRIAKPISF